MFRRSILLIILVILPFLVRAQVYPSRNFYIEPEWMIGRNIPIYDKFPASSFRNTFSLSLGYIHGDTTENWVSFYNYPDIGVSLNYSDLGNRSEFGKEFSLIPYILLKSSGNPKRSVDFRIGLGAAYFSRPYNAEYNPENLVIGTHLNWGFQFFIYKNLISSQSLIFRTGLGLLHTSDCHVVLPNFGLNSVMLAFALQVPQGPFDPMFAAEHRKLALDRRKHYFVQARAGIGWHQLGGTVDPIGGPTYQIHTYTMTGGVILKQQLKLSAGLSYRYYDSFYHYILHTPDIQWGTDPAFFRKHPGRYSSNVILFLGSEFLVGHIGLEFCEGFNLYKPFYREFNIRWDYFHGFHYWRSRYLATRLGVNYYFINTSRMPRNNFWIGAHINANYNKADFLEVSTGYCFKIR